MLQHLVPIKKRKQWLYVLLCWFTVFIGCISSTFAAKQVIDERYRVVLPIESRQEEARQKSFQEGLRQVVQQLTGNEEVANNPFVQQAIESAGQFVHQFSYQGNTLFVAYAPELINDLLLNNGFVIWSQSKPAVILWLAIADAEQRRIVGMDTDPFTYEKVNELAQQQGLSLVIPLMDLTDVHQVNVNDILGQFPTVLTSASKRYGTNAMLIGKVRRLQENWEGEWQLAVDDYHKSLHINHADFDQVIAEGVAFATKQLKLMFGIARQQTTGQSYRIQLKNIYSVGDLKKAESYLTNLEQIQRVSVKQISPYDVTFEVVPQGGVDQNMLSKVISMDRRMVSVPNADAKHESVALTYRWAP